MSRSQPCTPALLNDVHRLIADVWSVDGAGSEMHIGDLYWALFHHALIDYTTSVRLWYDDSEILQGVSLFPGKNWCDMVVRPSHLASPLSQVMIEWAMDECRRKNPAQEEPLTLRIGRRVAAPQRLDLLAQLGFRRMDFGYPALALRAYHQPPQAALPEGFVCRPLSDEAIPSRVAAFNSAFPGSNMTVNDYKYLISAPGYDSSLDLVVQHRSGEVAAFCTPWFDEINRVGLLEPVGCDARYRRRGLSKYCMLTGLGLLWERGATEAVVRVHSENSAALALYQACGFSIASTLFGHEKQIV